MLKERTIWNVINVSSINFFLNLINILTTFFANLKPSIGFSSKNLDRLYWDWTFLTNESLRLELWNFIPNGWSHAFWTEEQHDGHARLAGIPPIIVTLFQVLPKTRSVLACWWNSCCESRRFIPVLHSNRISLSILIKG